MFEVTVSGWFAASHQLRLADGSLEPLHGHNWKVAVTFAGPSLDEMEVLIDFTRVRGRLDELLKELHDRHLNDLEPFRSKNPSAERVAEFVALRMGADLAAPVRLRSVDIEEAPGCTARFLPGAGNGP